MTKPAERCLFLTETAARTPTRSPAILKERYGASVKEIVVVGPVIGAHSGPGTLALFFLGEHR